jgi:CheY-like chemotaxis protein
MSNWNRSDPRLVLLADSDRDTAKALRPLLHGENLELVHARAAIAALELFQRIPSSFALALISLDLPDLPGAVVVETLRLFRPELPVICLAAPGQSAPELSAAACVAKPLVDGRLHFDLQTALRDGAPPVILGTASPDAIARARARYAVSGDLLDAARELARNGREDGPEMD